MHSCSIVQLNRVVRRANATLELNEYVTWSFSISTRETKKSLRQTLTHQDVRIFQIVKEQNTQEASESKNKSDTF